MDTAEQINPVVPPPVGKKKSRLLRILKWAGIGFGSLLVLLVASAFIIVYFFEDDIKKYAVEQINKEVNTKIEVKDIKLSLFKKFPMASLEFIDVKCLEVTEVPKNNILEAKSVFLEFSIWDIFRGKYKFTKLSIENGLVDLRIDKQGQNNFNVIKAKPVTNKKKEEMSFRFREFTLKNMHFSFTDRKKHHEYRAQIKRLTCSGAFTEANYTLKAKTSFKTEIITVNDEDFLTNKNITINTSIDIQNDKHICTIKNSSLTLEEMKINLDGKVQYDSTAQVDLTFEGQQLNIQSFLSILPSNYKTFENKYKSNGNFYLKGKIKGSLAGKELPYINVDFGIQNGKIRFVEEDIEMNEIDLEGNFIAGGKENPNETGLVVKKLKGKLKNSNFSGEFSIKNPEHPTIQFTVDADLDLEEVFNFIKIKEIEKASGRVKTQLTYSGEFKTNTFTIEDYKKSTSQGKARLENVSLSMLNNPNIINQCSGEIVFENNIGAIPHLEGKIHSSSFKLRGEVINLPEYFLVDNHPLIIDATVSADQLKLEEFMTKSTDKKSKNKLTLSIPQNIDIHLQASIKEFEFKKFKASNVSGEIAIKNQILFAQNIQFNSCGGSANISGSVDTKDADNIVTQAFGTFQQIDISSLFYQFENFSQKAIEDKHIKGKTHADISYKAAFDKDLKMKLNTLYVQSPIVIENGELVDFKPLESLSKFIQVEELRHIRFSTLTNVIEIKDEAVIIPKMAIQSNALNLEIAGIHYFDNRIEYYFNILLKDLLAAKWKKKKKTEDEFGEIIEEEGGARLYLKMIGTVDNHKISVDRKGVKEKFKADMKQEGNELKQIFYEEFGTFKKDTTIKKSNLLPPKKEAKNKVKDNEEFEFE